MVPTAEAGDENGDPAQGQADPEGAEDVVDESLVHGNGGRARQEQVRTTVSSAMYTPHIMTAGSRHGRPGSSPACFHSE